MKEKITIPFYNDLLFKYFVYDNEDLEVIKENDRKVRYEKLYFSFALILKNKSYFFNMFLKIKGISLMIKLIATDMDGTFLDLLKRFSMEFFDIFEELRKRKIKFVIASGNQYFRLYQKFLPISNEMYFIGENGSYIAKGVKLIATNTLKKRTSTKR